LTLASILGQTFQDFELLIADNASTDETESVCRELAERDGRVRYHRHAENIGAAGNYNFTFEQASGEYFKWAAADDLIAPDYLERCIEVLDRDPGVVLAYSLVERIDENGQPLSIERYPMRVGSSKPHVRFRDLVCVQHSCFAVFGVVRRRDLGTTKLIASHRGSDRNLIGELGLLGRFHELPAPLLSRRMHPGSYSAGPKMNASTVQSWWSHRDEAQSPRASNAHRMSAYSDAISRAPLSRGERLLCRGALLGPYRIGRLRRLVKRRFAIPVRRAIVTRAGSGKLGSGRLREST
jgi:glycosyltransferase involved in cell wall biosynthesis